MMKTTRMRWTTPEAGFTEDNDLYLSWLQKKAGAEEYGELVKALHRLIFRPTIKHEPDDSSRANDGLRLRGEFIDKFGELGSSANRGACTMLEFLIGLARRMSFLMGEENQPSQTAHYFHELIRNLRLLRYTDGYFEEHNGEFFVEEAVQRVLDRTYGSDGDGGLFPLWQPHEDQRYVDFWYQMHAWLNEHNTIRME